MKSTSEVKLWRSMTDDEQRRYVERLTAFESEKLARLEQKQEAWGVEQRELMDEALELMAAWQFARDFVDKALRYGDYAARVYRVRFYVEKIKQEIERLSPDMLPTATEKKRKPGRPASAATLAKREAERKAAKQQVEMFKPAGEPAGTVAENGDGSVRDSAAFTPEPSPFSATVPACSPAGLNISTCCFAAFRSASLFASVAALAGRPGFRFSGSCGRIIANRSASPCCSNSCSTFSIYTGIR